MMNIPFDVDEVRKDFPVLSRKTNAGPLIYLDNAATSLKPIQVVDSINDLYLNYAGSIHRSVHQLGEEVNNLYKESRKIIAAFIGAGEDEIVFVRNTTEAINLVARSLPRLNSGRVLLSHVNHHSSFLPWKNRKYLSLTKDGLIDIENIESELSDCVLVCLPKVSNALGLQTPVDEIISIAHNKGCLVFVDGAQSVPHLPTSVKLKDYDFLGFSGHKMLAPFGIGVLYGKWTLLNQMEPFLLGGEMVSDVSKNQTVNKPPPDKFEAGTPNVEGAIGLATAIKYLDNIGMSNIHSYVQNLTVLARNHLREIDGLTVYGPDNNDLIVSSVSFNFPGMSAHTLAQLLSNRYGIMVRSGYHCSQPLHEALNFPPTVRASFYIYNTESEILLLRSALEKIRDNFLAPA